MKKSLSILSLLAVSAVLLLPEAHAAGLTDKVDNILDLTKAGGKVIVALAFLVGVVGAFMFITTLMKLSRQQPVENAPTKLVAYFLAAALGIGFSVFVIGASETIMGDDTGTAQSIDQSDFGL